MENLEQLCYPFIYFYTSCWDSRFVIPTAIQNPIFSTVVIKPSGFLNYFFPLLKTPVPEKLEAAFLPSSAESRLRWHLVMMWLPPASCALKSIPVTVQELRAADSSSPLLAALSLVLPCLPPPQIKAGIRDQNFLKLLSFWHLQSQEFRDDVKIIICNWTRNISFCSQSHRRVPFLLFSYDFTGFEARRGD